MTGTLWGATSSCGTAGGFPAPKPAFMKWPPPLRFPAENTLRIRCETSAPNCLLEGCAIRRVQVCQLKRLFRLGSLPPAASPPSTLAAVAGAVLEVMLPDGARLRLEGAVDPTLAAAVLRALATSGRAS